MNRYHIKRTNPNSGQIWEITPFGDEVPVTEVKPYNECKVYLMQHQQELHVYKVGCIGSRKNAKRRLHRRIFATGFVEAFKIFNTLDHGSDMLQLCTGDWKVLAQKEPSGKIKYFLN